MSLDTIIFYSICIGVPLIIFFGLQILRGMFNLWRSGGADVICIFAAVDAAIVYDPNTFTPMVKSSVLHPHVQGIGLISLIVGLVLFLPVTITYGERKLMEAERNRNAASTIQFGPFVTIWSCVVIYMGSHLLFFLGDWK